MHSNFWMTDSFQKNFDKDLEIGATSPSEHGPTQYFEDSRVVSSQASRDELPVIDKVASTASTIHKTPSQMPPPPAAPMYEPSLTQVESRKSEDFDFPEGGLKAWGVVFGSWCAMTATFGMVNTMGVLQAFLAENQLKGKSDSQISWIFSVYCFLFFFGGVQVGPIFDTYGLRFVLIPGCIGSTLSVFFLSVSKEYYQIMLGFGVLGGISASLVFTPAIAAVGHWFYARRGLATGIAATGGAVGGLVYPMAIRKMLDELSFGWTMRVIGFVVLLLCIGAVLTLRTRITPNDKKGASMDIMALKDPRFLLATLGTFMIEWGIFVPMNYLTTYALAYGIDSVTAYQLTSYLSVGSILGRGLPGYFADHFGRFNVMIVTATLAGVFCLTLWMCADGKLGPTVAFGVLFGFWSGTGICLTPVCISQICKTEDYGKRYGTCYFFVSFGVLTGMPIAGEIMNRQNGEFSGLIAFSGATYLCGALFFLAARIVGGGWNLKKIY